MLPLLMTMAPELARAQASPTLPLEHPAYRVIHRLAAAGVLSAMPRGERVMTRAEAAVKLEEGAAVATGLASSATDPAYSPLERQALLDRSRAILDQLALATRGLEQERRDASLAGPPIRTLRPLDRAELFSSIMDSPSRDVPENGLGMIVASVNPFGSLTRGRPMVHGVTTRLTTTHAWSNGGPVALYFSPRFLLDRPWGGEIGTEVGIEEAAIRIRLGNAEVRAGRDAMVRQQSMRAGVTLSTAPRSWDMVELGMAEPRELPSVLGLLGPVQVAAFWAHLGEEQTFPGGWMLGYRGSLRPHPRIELGGTALFQQGGEGGPEASWQDRFLDALLIPDLLDAENDYLFSNKLVGVDARFRLPWGRGVEVVFEGALEDFDLRRFRSTLVDNGAWVAGFFLPSVDRAGRVSLAAEYHRTGATSYRHSQYRTGFTLDRRPVGSPLGPDATGVYLRLDWIPSAWGVFTLDGAVEEYRADTYRGFPEPDFRYERVEISPRERRVRGVTSGAWTPTGRWDVLGRFGVEYIQNDGFNEGPTRVNFLGELGIGYRP